MTTLGRKPEEKDQTTRTIEIDQPVTYASNLYAIKQRQLERPNPVCMRTGGKTRPLHLEKHPGAAADLQLGIIAVRMALVLETTRILGWEG